MYVQFKSMVCAHVAHGIGAATCPAYFFSMTVPFELHMIDIRVCTTYYHTILHCRTHVLNISDIMIPMLGTCLDTPSGNNFSKMFTHKRFLWCIFKTSNDRAELVHCIAKWTGTVWWVYTTICQQKAFNTASVQSRKNKRILVLVRIFRFNPEKTFLKSAMYVQEEEDIDFLRAYLSGLVLTLAIEYVVLQIACKHV